MTDDSNIREWARIRQQVRVNDLKRHVYEVHLQTVNRLGRKEIWKDPCPISGNKWPCARHELCTWCTNEQARYKAASLYKRHEMITELKPWLSVGGELTKTLPGSWHSIRKAPLWDQYKYFTKRSRNKRWMKFLREHVGAAGGIEFLEITQNSSTGAWNLHSHDLLYVEEEKQLNIPVTKSVEYCGADGCNHTLDECMDDSHLVQPIRSKNVGGSWNKLREFGWGQRYSYDDNVQHEIAVGYLTKLAYAAKPIQFSTKIEDLTDLSRFMMYSRPRMTRVWGELRISRDERKLLEEINN